MRLNQAQVLWVKKSTRGGIFMKRIIIFACVCTLLVSLEGTQKTGDMKGHAEASQIIQQKQRPATKRELQMMQEAAEGTLTQEKLQAYLKGGFLKKAVDINAQDL